MMVVHKEQMTSAANYKVLDKIFEGDVSSIFRSVRISDSAPVVLKMHRKDHPSHDEILDLKYEYLVTSSLENHTGVITALGLEEIEGRPVMILEDFGGESLDRIMNRSDLSFEERIVVALKTCECIGQIHSAGIIHKDLNPSNIVFNRNSGQIKIIDFGIASGLAHEDTQEEHPKVIKGTLPYIAPEQTGRMNLPIDYRSDYYCLGASLYQLFTNRLPFESKDPLELVHCHVAVKPEPPSKVNHTVPEVLSNIILKLLEKNAGNRYQSVIGIMADLEACLNQLRSCGVIGDIQIAEKDVPQKLVFTQRIYGREKEAEIILNAFNRTSNGSRELVTISGEAGIGKTSLVKNIQAIVTSRNGYFVSGKFDQLKRNILDNAVLQPFRELVTQLLAESEESLSKWKVRLIKALAPNAQVIIDVIPELELILGPQSVPPKLEPVESENRFKLQFQNFLSVFCLSERPVVIFLDDIQWADLFSLKLLELMVADADKKFLLVIIAYRDEEVDSSHPFVMTMDKMPKHDLRISSLSLGPIQLEHTSLLISDSLGTDGSSVNELAEIAHQKTQGNPFFLKEFLKSVYEERLVYFDHAIGSWTWDASQIQGRDVTQNVAALLKERILKLPSTSQDLLKVAACMGNRFDLASLSLFYEDSETNVVRHLGAALDETLIYPTGEGHKLIELGLIDDPREIKAEYKFAHDRIQQAAYSLIPEDARPLFHRKLGQAMLQNTRPDQINGKIFDIVTQLNLASDLTNDEDDRFQLAELNFRAGKQAGASTAHETALSFCKRGIKLLGEEGWRGNYDLMLELCTEFTLQAFLATRFDEMEEAASRVLSNIRDFMDGIKIHEVAIQALIAQNRRLEAVKTALPILRLLGQTFPDKPGKINFVIDLIKTRWVLIGREIESLSKLPRMTDEKILAVMRILRSVLSAAYTVAPELMALMIFRMVRLSLKFGLARESAFAFVAYAMINTAILDDVDSGIKFGDIALSLTQNQDCREDQARVMFVVCSFLKIRVRSLRDGLKPLLDNYHLGRELGDFEFASTSAAFYCTHSYSVGKYLPELEKEVSTLASSMEKMKQETTKYLVEVYHQEILNMMEPSGNPCLLRGRAYDEEKMAPQLIKAQENSIICAVYIQKLRLCYLFRDYETAIQNVLLAERYIEGAKGSMLVPALLFYGSLARLAIFDQLSRKERRAILRQVSEKQKILHRWALRAPMNFMNEFHFVEAERFRCLGRIHMALDQYDTVIEVAREKGYLNEEALANERAAMFLLSLGNKVRARSYFGEARNCYLKWGALTKVKDLDDNYSEFLGGISSPGPTRPDSPVNMLRDEDIDLTAVIRASQSISGEIVLEKLLEKLMTIVIQIAGAEKGFLVMEKEGSLFIRAKAGGLTSQAVELELKSVPEISELSSSIINYVSRTKKPLILEDAASDPNFVNDPYIRAKLPKSICCLPVIRGGELTGILYLENNQAIAVFSPDRVEMLNVIATQAATSIENATLYRSLEESATKYRSLFENAQEAIFITQGGKFRFCNPKTLELMGYNEDELLRKDVSDIICPDDFATYTEHQIRSLNLRSTSSVCNFRIIRADLSILWTHNNSVFMEWEGKPATLNFLTDVTDLKKAADVNARTERFKAISELASGVAHNFNNLLQILLGGVELALMELDAGNIRSTRKSLEQIRESAKIGSETVKRLQSFAGIRSQHSTSEGPVFDLSETVSHACNFSRPLWKTSLEKDDVNIEMKLDVASGCFVKGKESEIFEVLFNLIKNAVEAMPRGGTIRISTRTDEQKVLLMVEDTGVGIAERDLQRMFEPFWTTKGPAGTGLGLMASQKIINEHGGKISVKSEIGQGTCFKIEMPLAAPSSDQSQIRTDTSPAKNLRILVIDDSRQIVTLLKEILEGYRQKVLGACSGEEGLDLFNKNEVDVVICDLGMPGMSGWQVGKRLVSSCRQRGIPKIPFILLTGWGGQSLEQDKLTESGVDGIMEKPVDMRKLIGLISSVTPDSTKRLL